MNLYIKGAGIENGYIYTILSDEKENYNQLGNLFFTLLLIISIPSPIMELSEELILYFEFFP